MGISIFKPRGKDLRPKTAQTPSLMSTYPFPSSLLSLFYFYYGSHFSQHYGKSPPLKTHHSLSNRSNIQANHIIQIISSSPKCSCPSFTSCASCPSCCSLFSPNSTVLKKYLVLLGFLVLVTYFSMVRYSTETRKCKSERVLQRRE